MHQFSAGDVVTCISDMFLRHAAPGDYKVIASMPDRDGDHMYRIKSPLEEHERVVKESLLVKSEGHLLEEVPVRRPRGRPITLPTRYSLGQLGGVISPVFLNLSARDQSSEL
jgi:hypothetical protein